MPLSATNWNSGQTRPEPTCSSTYWTMRWGKRAPGFPPKPARYWPSTIVAFSPKPTLKQPITIPAGIEVASVPVEGTSCIFRTCYDVELHPIDLVDAAFVESATAAYDTADVVAQLDLVFANPELTVAFEHELIGQRGGLSQALADHREANSVGWRDAAAAGSMLGALIAVLERWSATGGDKALAKQLTKAYDGTR